MEEKITIVFVDRNNNSTDFETPIDITLRDLIEAIDNVLHIGLDADDITEKEIVIENPIRLIKLNKTLEELGFRQGTTIYLK